jgi:predicted Rossmann-fold nucleotide-binding protein
MNGNSEPHRRVRRQGPVTLRGQQIPPTTTDERLLDRRGPSDWVHTDPWRVLRIQAEFVEGFGLLAELGPAVSVFGSARTARGSSEYETAERIAFGLAEAGYAVITGGGPGAMEAANLGAYAAPHPDEMLDESLEILAKTPSFSPSISDWARAAFEVRGRWPGGAGSVGIPTWFYGHEPPNAFAGHIAKYFANATREDGLLARCNAGVVFLPGAAGTVQEVFDNATPNYYESRGEPTPMVLVDREHWTRKLPAWPLLTALARERSMESRIALVDSVAEAPEALARLSG